VANKFKYGGYAGQRLRIDLTKSQIKKVPQSEEDCALYLGGRGLDAKILYDELPVDVDPLSPDNILCLSAGPIVGLLGPTTGRMNVAARSPLTGIYGNSNVGAYLGAELKMSGYDDLIIKGRAEKPSYIYICDDEVEVRDASHLWGKNVIETTRILQEDLGEEFRVAAIGQAAENGVLFANIMFDYWEAAGRTGLGAVMASKNIKAIAAKGSGELTVHDPKRYMEVVTDAWRAVEEDPGFQTGEHSALGTSVVLMLGNVQGWLPVRNFLENYFEYAENVSAEEFRDRFSTKKTPIPGGRACMSCPNRCKRYGVIESGKYVGTKGGLEFEAAGGFGPKCGVGDLEAVFHAAMLANDYGMDAISLSSTIAFLMEMVERGMISKDDLDGVDLRFGNAEAMIEAIHRIARVQGKLGQLGSMGVDRAAKAIGKGAERWVTTVKGLETISTDPRVSTGFGFGYAVASRGSDHLRAHPVIEMVTAYRKVAEELFGSPEVCTLAKYGGRAKMVYWHENMAAITDSIGSCRFMHASYYALYPIPELMAKYGLRRGKEVHSIKYHEWISAATGIPLTYEDLVATGERIVTLERALNTRFGIRRQHDTLPRRFLEEPVASGPYKGAVFKKEALEALLDEYYDLRGWDKATGLIKESTLKRLSMRDVLEDLKQRGLLAGE
jgi:aldehyde:ferredoxin oxidoreductase